MSLRIGDLVLARSIKSEQFAADGKWRASFSYKALKGHTFALLLIGECETTDDPSPDALLRRLGWSFQAEPPAPTGGKP